MRVFALSIHADYRCRHSGACCTADWDVPVELPIYRSLEQAVADHRLQVSPEAGSVAPFVTEPDLPNDAAAMLERTSAGNCVFFDSRSRLCIVHRDLGQTALPVTCRHFPRVSVQDVRGTFVSLSHFCPTAASMLFRDGVPVEILESPPAFPDADYDGLTVTDDDLPPLLHPRMLMDLDGYSAWEAHMVRRCAEVGRQPESVVATLMRDARLLARWKPGAGGPEGPPLRTTGEYAQTGGHTQTSGYAQTGRHTHAGGRIQTGAHTHAGGHTQTGAHTHAGEHPRTGGHKQTALDAQTGRYAQTGGYVEAGLQARLVDQPRLVDAIAALPPDFVDARHEETLARSLEHYAEVMRAVPDELRPEPDDVGLEAAFERHVRHRWDEFRAPLNRFLAAKAFASWTAYQGRGIATIVRGLDAALALVRVEAARLCRDAAHDLQQELMIEAIRSADFALNHLAVGEDLAEAWSSVEQT